MEKIYFGKNDTLRTRNGQYLIDSVTESGNAIMARGHNTNNGQRVIIKRYQPWKDGSEKMIQRELKALQKIKDKKHKGVVELLDFSEDTSTLVLEDLGEIELAGVVREGKLKAKTAMRITREILKTAEFLAGNGIFHRDIKPENIIYVPKRGPVLIDFGIATVDGQHITEDKTLAFGSPFYMGRETLMGNFEWEKSESLAIALMMIRLLEDEKALIPTEIVLTREFFESRKRRAREFMEKTTGEIRRAIGPNLEEEEFSKRDTLQGFRERIERVEREEMQKILDEREAAQGEHRRKEMTRDFGLGTIFGAGLGTIVAGVQEIINRI